MRPRLVVKTGAIIADASIMCPQDRESSSRISRVSKLGSSRVLKDPFDHPLTPFLARKDRPFGGLGTGAGASTIVHQGDPADSFYLARSGEVQVVMERDDRLAAPIATLGPKEAFGEMALLTDQPHRSFTIVAMSDAELWRLPKPYFDGLLTENLSLAMYFNRLLSQRLKVLQEKVYL